MKKLICALIIVSIFLALPMSAFALVGDFDGDGVVSPRDLLVMLQNFGRSGDNILNPAADLNGDGVVNALDLIIFMANYGKVAE